MNKSNLNFVICLFFKKSLSSLKNFLNRNKINNVVVVLNNCQVEKELIKRIDSNVEILIGKNETYDFSAYKDGLDYLINKNENIDIVYFLNDSFFSKYDFNFNYKLFSKNHTILRLIKQPCILGYKSMYNSVLNKNPWTNSPFFIPTFCFALNREGVYMFFKIYEDLINSNKLMKDNLDLWSESIGNQFINFLKIHLFSNKNPISWKGDISYNLDNSDLFIKARCIYLEHKISGEFYSKGHLVFVNQSLKNEVLLKFRNRIKSLFS